MLSRSRSSSRFNIFHTCPVTTVSPSYGQGRRLVTSSLGDRATDSKKLSTYAARSLHNTACANIESSNRPKPCRVPPECLLHRAYFRREVMSHMTLHTTQCFKFRGNDAFLPPLRVPPTYNIWIPHLAPGYVTLQHREVVVGRGCTNRPRREVLRTKYSASLSCVCQEPFTHLIVAIHAHHQPGWERYRQFTVTGCFGMRAQSVSGR